MRVQIKQASISPTDNNLSTFLQHKNIALCHLLAVTVDVTK